jgi:hypothetical protein
MDIQAWSRLFAIASMGIEGLVIVLFLYVLLVPWIHGIEPDVGSFHYRASFCMLIIPSIVLGEILVYSRPSSPS